MKILSINGKFLSQPITGVQRYAAEIVNAWDEGLEEGWIDRADFSIQIEAPRQSLQTLTYRHVIVRRGTSTGRLWEQVELPYRSRGTLLFSPYAAAPVMKVRHAVTIHDAGAAASSQQYSMAFRGYCFVVYRALGRWCKPIFTVSEFSRSELEEFYLIPSEKVTVIPPGCDHLLRTTPDVRILERHDLVKGSYILGVSSRSAIKNFDGLARAFKELAPAGIRLAIAGKCHPKLFGEAASNNLDGVVELGYVSDAELRALYENAALFAYPSFYEGFGIPPIEAMFCGCPVLVARGSSLPETCGDAALYCDPSSISDIAKGISRILSDHALASNLRQKGLTRAAKFTARQSAMRLWSALEAHL